MSPINATFNLRPRADCMGAFVECGKVLKNVCSGRARSDGQPAGRASSDCCAKGRPGERSFQGTVSSLTDMIARGESLDPFEVQGKAVQQGCTRAESQGTAWRRYRRPARAFHDVEARSEAKLAQLGSRLIDGFAKRMARISSYAAVSS